MSCQSQRKSGEEEEAPKLVRLPNLKVICHVCMVVGGRGGVSLPPPLPPPPKIKVKIS